LSEIVISRAVYSLYVKFKDLVEAKLDDLEPYKNSLGKSYISLSGLYDG